MIHLNQITKIYRTSEIETTALNQIDLNIKEGEFVSIMGKSGCGKSTLLNILGMLDSPSNGTYLFNGLDVSAMNEKQRAQVRKHNIGFIFQNFNLIDELSVYENVELPLFYLGIPKGQRKTRVMETLELMGIAHRAKHYPSQLSGGQQQRVAVCRAVVGQPKLILADEPTGNLDSHFGKEVLESIKRLHVQGTTVVMVTHSRDDAAYSERIIQLYDGSLMQPNSLNIAEHVQE